MHSQWPAAEVVQAVGFEADDEDLTSGREDGSWWSTGDLWFTANGSTKFNWATNSTLW